MPTILQYCTENIEALRAYNQANMQWGQYNKAPFKQIPQFAAVLRHIPPAISRGNIIQTFKDEEYYKGFVMILLNKAILKLMHGVR